MVSLPKRQMQSLSMHSELLGLPSESYKLQEIPQHVHCYDEAIVPPLPSSLIAATDICRISSPTSPHASETILLSLPPPPPYDVCIRSLSIGFPTSTPVYSSLKSFTAAFKNLRIKYNQPHNSVKLSNDGLIVRHVSATIRCGEMMAIIGGSGSGKTTLLHAIASRLGNLHIVDGSIDISPTGLSKDGSRTTASSTVLGFVRQNDYLLPYLTVRETLDYAARLRLPSYVDNHTRTLIVDQTIQELGLVDVADVVVGGSNRKGISGGEKRRLSVGCILVSFPSILVLDEVTTGLDSFSAGQLMEMLSRLTKKGRTIILSLHQPRSDIFPLCSQLLLMSQGSVVYSGPSNSSLSYFSNLGFTPDNHTNPFDFLIDISSLDSRDETSECDSQQRLDTLVQTWLETHEAHSNTPTVNIISACASNNPETNNVETRYFDSIIENKSIPENVRRPGILLQITILLPRAWKNVMRAYHEVIGHFVQSIAIGVYIGISFYRLKEQPKDIQSLKTLTFQSMAVYGYMSQLVWMWQWCTTLAIFDREREDGLYHPTAWLICEWTAWMPVNITAPSIFAIITYFMCAMRTDYLAADLGIFVAAMIFIQLCFVAWSLFITSIQRNFPKASLIGNLCFMFFVFSPGFFLVNVPGWIRWFRWLSPLFYCFRAVVTSQFRHRQFACVDTTGVALYQCTGDNVLRGLRIAPSQQIWPMMLGSLAFFLVVLICSLVLLSMWTPRGLRYASRRTSSEYTKGKKRIGTHLDLIRTRVNVKAEGVSLYQVHRDLLHNAITRVPILTSIDATFASSQITVIMGPSGSGKSTFLRLCSGRPIKNNNTLSSFEVHGKILFNGISTSGEMQQFCGFVEQEDEYHLPALTVRETIQYTALLRLPSSISRKRKLERAEDVLRMLGLRDCADTIVGRELLKGISGGEKRRLSLACQMVNDPAVLIVDEPTSGLDAHTARTIMEVLVDIARSGRTVIVSLHQPRSEIYNMIDNVILLAKGGNIVYQGSKEDLSSHFRSAGYTIPPLYNPADYYMDIISVDMRSPVIQDQSLGRIENLLKLREDTKVDTEEISPIILDHALLPYIGGHEDKPPLFALPIILQRSLRNTWRQSDVFWTRIVQGPFQGVAFLIFWLRLTRGPSGAQDRIGLVTESSTALPFLGFISVAALYPTEKSTFIRDYQSAGGRYSTGTFILSLSLFAIIPEILGAVLFALIINLGTGMQTSPRIFFEFAVSSWAQINFGESVGIALLSLFPVDIMGLSVSLVSVFLSAAGQCSGIYSPSMPTFLIDIAYIFPMSYASRIMLTNEMTGLQFNCSTESINSGQCIAASGNQVLDLFGFHQPTSVLTGIMIVVTLSYRVASWAILTIKMRYES